MEPLKPRIKPILVKGKLYYCEGDRSNSIIRLKREIRDEFLENIRKNIKYQIEYYRTKQELKERMENLMNGDQLPFLLFLYRDEKE